MTAKELIEELKKHDPFTPVKFIDKSNGYVAKTITKVSRFYEPSEIYLKGE